MTYTTRLLPADAGTLADRAVTPGGSPRRCCNCAAGRVATVTVAARLPARTKVRIVFILPSTSNRRKTVPVRLTPAKISLRPALYNQVPAGMAYQTKTGDLDADEINRLLRAWSDGDQNALAGLTPIVYEELRRLAHY